jgi:hypothetical protein
LNWRSGMRLAAPKRKSGLGTPTTQTKPLRSPLCRSISVALNTSVHRWNPAKQRREAHPAIPEARRPFPIIHVQAAAAAGGVEVAVTVEAGVVAEATNDSSVVAHNFAFLVTGGSRAEAEADSLCAVAWRNGHLPGRGTGCPLSRDQPWAKDLLMLFLALLSGSR